MSRNLRWTSHWITSAVIISWTSSAHINLNTRITVAFISATSEFSTRRRSRRPPLTRKNGVTFAIECSKVQRVFQEPSAKAAFSLILIAIALFDFMFAHDAPSRPIDQTKPFMNFLAPADASLFEWECGTVTATRLRLKWTCRPPFTIATLMMCSHCSWLRSNYEAVNFGERCIVVSRDYSCEKWKRKHPLNLFLLSHCGCSFQRAFYLKGYEFSPFKANLDATFSETSEDILHRIDSSKIFCCLVGDEDVNIDIGKVKKPQAIFDDGETPLLPLVKLKSPSSSVTIHDGSKQRRRNAESTTTWIIQKSFDASGASSFLSQSQSILRDISDDPRRLIQFCANPLDELSASTAVKLVKETSIFNDLFPWIPHNWNPTAFLPSQTGRWLNWIINFAMSATLCYIWRKIQSRNSFLMPMDWWIR